MAARGYTGTIAGIALEDGRPVGDLKDTPANRRAAVAIAGYALRHGLAIEDDRLVVVDVESESPDPRSLGDGIVVVGTKLRDAAVDPKPQDFLPPTNAGEANPHGPDVVSPEIHGSQGVRPITPGPVAVIDPPVQEAVETAHAAAHTEATLPRPKASARKAEWVEYAVAQGMARDEAEATNRDDLVAAYPEEA